MGRRAIGAHNFNPIDKNAAIPLKAGAKGLSPKYFKPKLPCVMNCAIAITDWNTPLPQSLQKHELT